jgi:phosphoglucosamine mutase
MGRLFGTDGVRGLANREVTAELAGVGRVLLRPSGTEPLVRVMVEAADRAQAERVAKRPADVVQDRLAL